MTFEVLLTEDASKDLVEIYHYIDEHDVPGKADYVLEKLESTFNSLANHPNRGTYPPELNVLGIREFREVFFKPYRIIYRAFDQKVIVFVIADGRRNMQFLLQRRLLRA